MTEAHLLSGWRREARRRVDVGCLELARTYVVQCICTILEAHTCIMRGFVGGGLIGALRLSGWLSSGDP